MKINFETEIILLTKSIHPYRGNQANFVRDLVPKPDFGLSICVPKPKIKPALGRLLRGIDAKKKAAYCYCFLIFTA
jgi:hypothetical protein